MTTPTGPYPPQYQPQWAPGPPQPQYRNGLGTTGFVLGLLAAIFAWVPFIGVIGWPLAIVGAIFSSLGLQRATKGLASNKGMSIAGVVLSAVALVFCVIYAIAFASAVSDAAATGTVSGSSRPASSGDAVAPAVVPPISIATPLPAAVPTPTNTASAPETFAAAPPEPTTPALSVSRQNAVESAERYLDYSAFSRKGLIDQLEYEDFSTADATYAVDHVTVDWNEQAAKSAKSYMDYSSFSRGSLIDQLKYEGFTAAQAKHGADSVGL